MASAGSPSSASRCRQGWPQQLEVDGRSTSFQVGNRDYRAQHITLKNQRQVNPNPADLKRIERELDEQNRAYRQFSTHQPSNLLFDRPVDGPLSSPFGLRRFFNGEERNPHSGLDFAAKTGTPIKAPAAGKVILTGDYFFQWQDGVPRPRPGADQITDCP